MPSVEPLSTMMTSTGTLLASAWSTHSRVNGPLSASTMTMLVSPAEVVTVLILRSSHPDARIAEHAHPRRILAPVLRVPAHLRRAEHPLRVRHHDRDATVGGRECGQATRRTVRVERVA